MIQVRDRNVGVFYVNPHQIKRIDAHPTTKITLMNGESVLILDPIEDVLARIKAYDIEIHGGKNYERLGGSA